MRQYSFKAILLPALTALLFAGLFALQIHDSVNSYKHDLRTANLRRLAEEKGLFIGASTDPTVLCDPSSKEHHRYTSSIRSHFNMLTPSRELTWNHLERNHGTHDFEWADCVADFSEKHNQTLRGFTLVSGSNNPKWMDDHSWTEQTLTSVLQNHISTVLGRYKGQFYAWDVVSDALQDPPSSHWFPTTTSSEQPPLGIKPSLWTDVLPNFVDVAFVMARQADPSAKLFYNDRGIEKMGPKSDALYAMVKGMQKRGVPIDGIGFQLHTSASHRPSEAEFAQNIKRFADLGLEVHITQMEVHVPSKFWLKEQASAYSSLLKVCIDNPACKSVTLWGLTDAHTLSDSALSAIFDDDYHPKPAFFALADVLKSNENNLAENAAKKRRDTFLLDVNRPASE